MADNIGNKAAHDYHLDVPAAQEGFYVKEPPCPHIQPQVREHGYAGL